MVHGSRTKCRQSAIRYLKVLREDPIEVVECEWKPYSIIEAEYVDLGKKVHISRKVQTGEVLRMENLELKIEIMAVQNSPPRRLKMVKMPNETLVLNSYPNLRCKENKLTQECITPLDDCKCQYTGHKQKCVCPPAIPSRREMKPLNESNLEMRNGRIYKEEGDITLMMTTRGTLHIEAYGHQDKCKFEVNGNRVECQSEKHEVMGHLRCNSTTFYMTCEANKKTVKTMDVNGKENVRPHVE
ncbi:unnamed protein product [Bursaphelenchus xylophilus]|uniref:(pine wood nematode) hypothetical protein n=1 Tax=Bursaphelenchus xylophilus TaxID=6326 RepID=A0A1I7RU84_BURXY|nr:unnamed protein product [Bursaphelenchus xylophilus]CAG9113918.1 unnamed protein product [Bursaphelenchus xylophilus]